MEELVKRYLIYRESGGNIKNFNEWIEFINEEMELEKEYQEYLKLDEDFLEAEEYFDILNEAVKLTIDKKDRIKNAEEAQNRYDEYKRKRKAKGKSFLSFDKWIKTQDEIDQIKSEATKAGIKIAGTVGAAVATSHILKKMKGHKIEVNFK